MTWNKKHWLIAGGGAVLFTALIWWRVRKSKSENEDNEAFVLMQEEEQSKAASKSQNGKKNTQSKPYRAPSKSQAQKLASLHPDVRSKVQRMMNKAKQKGIELFIVSAHRGEAEQNELYSRGRSQAELNKVGLSHVKAQPEKRKVTNARAGKSDHNVKRAVDLVEIKKGKLLWNNDRWEQIGKIGESVGLKWGGRWKSFVDKPHFYDRGGKTVAQLWGEYKRTGQFA